MKLAEALQERADINKRISELKRRLDNCLLVQEGEEPAEDPVVLLKELDSATERLEKLMAVQNEISLAKNLLLEGSGVEVLVEGASKTDEKIFTGRTRTNKLILFEHGNERVGDLVNVKISQAQTFLLKGEVCR